MKLLLILCCIGPLVADTKGVSLFGKNFGKTYYTHETLPQLFMVGSATLENTHVVKETQVVGTIQATSSTFGDFKVKGRACLNGCTVKGSTTIYGALEATDTVFLKPITLFALQGLFKGSETKDIYVQTTTLYVRPERVTLEDTVVLGNIVFESKKGEVLLLGTSKITGDIIGGLTVDPL